MTETAEVPGPSSVEDIIALVADDIADTESRPWVPSPMSGRTGVETRLVRVRPSTGEWTILARYATGTVMPRRRLLYPAHGFQLEGYRQLLQSGKVVGPGSYVYQAAGIHEGFRASGDSPLMFWCLNRGPIEYLDDKGRVALVYDVDRLRQAYGPNCEVVDD